MHAGKIMEYATTHELFFDPRHPYSWALLGSTLQDDPERV